jgi:hypothetical protein
MTRGIPVVVNLAEYSGLPQRYEPISLLKGTLNSHSRLLNSVFIAGCEQRNKEDSQR